MGTRSRIGVMHGDVVKSIYCHWDGYLEHNGAILQEYYDSAKANHLVAMGDMSSLDKEIGVEHPFGYHGSDMSKEDYEAQFSDMCTFYGRDRKETGTEFKVAHTFAEFLEQVENCCGEWYYIMKDGVWYCGNIYSNHPLSRKLTALTEALETVKETISI
jgi:hypothetical protein